MAKIGHFECFCTQCSYSGMLSWVWCCHVGIKVLPFLLKMCIIATITDTAFTCLHRITYSLSRHQSTQLLLRGCQGENNRCKISWVSCNPFYFLLFLQHSVTRNNNSSGSVNISCHHSLAQVQRERPGREQQRAEIAFKNPSLTLFGRYIANSSLSQQRVESFSYFEYNWCTLSEAQKYQANF